MKQKKALFSLLLIIVISPLNSFESQFSFGLENIPDNFVKKIKNARIALITNQTGKDQHGRRNIDILRDKGLNLKAILVPEHGLDGKIVAGKETPNSIDKKTRIKIISLYQQGHGKEITKNMIDDFDILIFDIQDSGTRHYTYISTMFDTLNAAAQFDKYYIILDRPNPLGLCMEGPIVEDNLRSFVSIAPIPLRHAMTVGELGWFFNKHILEKPAKLHVIKMKGYERTHGLKNTPFNTLSPNISSLKSCHGYSFLGLLSAIHPFDVGLKTDNAFQIILLPERISLSQKEWYKLQHLLKTHKIESVPYKRYHKKNKEMYTGLKLTVHEINKTHSFTVALDIIDFFKKSGTKMSFAPIFDKLTGTKSVRHYIEGSINRITLSKQINESLNNFLSKADSSFMYKPEPHVAVLR